MSDIRISPLEPPFDEAVATSLHKMMPPNSPVEPLALFRVLVQHEDLASRMRPLSAGILAHGLLAPQHRELLILRTCARCGAEYEWGVHVTFFAKQVGLTEQQIHATVHGDSSFSGWSKEQSTLIRLVDALHESADVDDDLWNTVNQIWSTEQMIEILIIVGWYHAISYVANVSRIPYEQWAERFPE